MPATTLLTGGQLNLVVLWPWPPIINVGLFKCTMMVGQLEVPNLYTRLISLFTLLDSG